MKKIPVTQERNQNTGQVAIISIIEDDAASGFLGFFFNHHPQQILAKSYFRVVDDRH